MSIGITHKDIGTELTEAEFDAVDSHTLVSGASFPGSPTEKDLFYRTDEHKWYIYNGTDWALLSGTDISAADATVGDVKDPKTFFSVSGSIKTGTMPTVAVAPASSAYPAGYHVGDVGGLPAIDADLVTANIKSGVTIFNVAGAATVQEIGAADAAVADVKDPKTFFSVTGAIKTGTMPTVAIVAANDTYAAGYHAGNAGGLDAVDTDLASANIKSGITIFGKAGAATVQEIGAANAAVTDVLSPHTFFSVTGAIKTGTMATVAIAADNNAYPAGYHAGAAGLSTIDASLAAANIKSGINIFGFTGPATVQDIADADLVVVEAPTGKKFYAVTGGVKTGTGTKTLNPASEAVAAGYYAATNLSTVDADLAAANIKSGVTIFGKAGTLAPVQDLIASANGLGDDASGSLTAGYVNIQIPAASEVNAAPSLTQIFASNSMAVGSGMVNGYPQTANTLKLRLYMGGVQVAENTYWSDASRAELKTVLATRALSGSQIVKTTIYNYDGATLRRLYSLVKDTAVEDLTAMVMVGSVKI